MLSGEGIVGLNAAPNPVLLNKICLNQKDACYVVRSICLSICKQYLLIKLLMDCNEILYRGPQLYKEELIKL